MLPTLAPTSCSSNVGCHPHGQGGAEKWGIIYGLHTPKGALTEVQQTFPLSSTLGCYKCPVRTQGFEIVDSGTFFPAWGLFWWKDWPVEFPTPPFFLTSHLCKFLNFISLNKKTSLRHYKIDIHFEVST